MTSHTKRLLLSSAILLCLQITCLQSAKPNTRPVPVHEVINEQSRNDEKVRIPSSPGILPYGNPLAGNSQQNARIHAKNQQAMFNAERIRQHRAQLQRWTKAPIKVDSYMKAYQESQESQQLALEQQQTSQRDAPVTGAPKPRQRQRSNYRITKNLKDAEPTKITRADAVIKNEKSRNHRSYGSLDYHKYLQPNNRYQTVLVTPGPTYDQGVTIKPNGNIGLTNLQQPNDETKLFTEAIPSATKYLYPKHYNQMKTYQSSQDIDMLNSLLKKTPYDQLSELNSLIDSSKPKRQEHFNDELNTPVDLYFYLKDHPSHLQAPNYGIEQNNANAYLLDAATETRDHKPIVEEVDDIEDPNKINKGHFGFQTIPTEIPLAETTTTKSNNYYKVEVASQTITSGFKPVYPAKQQVYYQNNREEEPKYKHYAQSSYHTDPKIEGDLSERYLHHNAQHEGIQHLSGDGTGVSAYGNENVSKIHDKHKRRTKRETLETDPFVLPNDTDVTNNTKTKAEPLIRILPTNLKRLNLNRLVNDRNLVGESNDYHYNQRLNNHNLDNYGAADEAAYEDDYSEDQGTDFNDYSASNTRQPSLILTDNDFVYAPSIGYDNRNNDYVPRNRHKSRYSLPSGFGAPDLYSNVQTYGAPSTYTPVYGPPNYKPKSPIKTGGINLIQNFEHSSQDVAVPSEPVYILTEKQLKSLIGHHNLNIQHLDVFQYAKESLPQHNQKKHRKPYHRYRNYHKHSHYHKLHYAANYEFGYRVQDLHSGNHFGHHEEKTGDNTNGQYHVLLPDGRMQQVKYSAGPEGFHADISYDHLH